MAISLYGIIKGILLQNATDRTKQISIEPSDSATTGTKTTLTAAQTANRTLTLPNVTDTLAGISATQTLTNKSIDADANTITNIENADIKAGAAIDASKIADGTVSNTEFQYIGGLTSDAQTQLDDLSSDISDVASDLSTHEADTTTHGTTGNIVGTSDSQTLTNKTIDADLNTLSNIENADIKAGAAIDATKIADGSISNTEFQRLNGVTSDIQTQLDAKSGITGTFSDNRVLRADGTTSIQTSGVTLSDVDAISGVTSLTVDNIAIDGDTISNNNASNDMTLSIGAGRAVKVTRNLEVGTVSAELSSIRLKEYSVLSASQLELRAPTSVSGSPVVSFPNATTTLVGHNASQVITNKDIDGGTASNTNRITIPKDTKANLDGLVRKEATLLYASDVDTLYVDNGDTLQEVGSGGSGFKNIIANSNAKFETGVADWVTYDDGATATPVDGSGGAPSAITLDIEEAAEARLEGFKSLIISKSAADGQGEGASVDSDILDNADIGKPLYVSFSYDTSNLDYDAGDLKVFAYDLANNERLTVYNNDDGILLAGQSGTKFNGVIYPKTNCDQVRLIFHCATTNAAAWDVIVDEILITPQALTVSGPIITDWESFTPVGIHSTNTTYTGTKRRVGQNLEMIIKVAYSGAPNDALQFITIPDSLNIDTSIMPLGSVPGTCIYYNASGDTSSQTGYSSANISVNSATDLEIGTMAPVNSSTVSRAYYETDNGGNFFNTLASGDFYTIHVTVPIVGWSNTSNTFSQNDTAVQSVRMSSYKNAGTSTANTTIASWTAEESDEWSAFDSTTGIFTAPRSGDYFVSFHAKTTSGTPVASIRKNGTIVASGAAAVSTYVSSFVNCVTGDEITVTLDGSLTFVSDNISTRLFILGIPDFTIFGLQGPVVVAQMSDWTSYTPTGSWSTNTTYTGKWRRVGDSAEIIFKLALAGAPTAANLTVNLPDGLLIDTTKLLEATADRLGDLTVFDDSADSGQISERLLGEVRYSSTTAVSCVVLDPTSGNSHYERIINATTPITFANADKIFGRIVVPIQGWTSDERVFPAHRTIGTAFLRDNQSSGTAAQSISTGSYSTIRLNTLEGDTNFISLSSNAFTLDPGTYRIHAYVPVASSGAAGRALIKPRLQNTSDATTTILGMISGDSEANGRGVGTAVVLGQFTITAEKTFEIQARPTATALIGQPCSFGDDETYTCVEIEKIY